MKARKQISFLIIMIFLTLNYSICVPDVSATFPSFPSSSDQFIGEIFPNCTLPLGLSHSNTIITVNATKSLKNVGITFDANYTIYNPENTTTITVIVPFSLAVDKLTFEVYADNTHIDYDLFNASPWNENITEINIYYLPGPFDKYPITLIKSNVTLLKNDTSVIRYHFSGLMSNPLDSRDVFFIAYFLGSSLEWIGNTTGKIELIAYGKQPVFTYSVVDNIPPQLIVIDGGQSFICEWNDIEIQILK
ncbi:MAG: hypothetical protein V3V33_00365, partial [Candidatus Lokiarchaeia archaeon]